MESTLYSYSLSIALPLMVFFSLYFIFARTPEKVIFNNYLRSRRIMGIAMLLLSANYAIHFFTGIRFKNTDAAIVINLSTYFICYWLFSTALTTLLDRFYITQRRVWTNICLWVAFSAVSCFVLFSLKPGAVKTIVLSGLATLLIIYGIFLSKRLLKAYHKAVNIFCNTRADDIGAYIKWLSIFTYWAVIFGVGCGLLTLLPDRLVFVWILSSIPFYIYLFYCYQNYLLFYEQVESAMESEMTSEDNIICDSKQCQTIPAYHNEISKEVEKWIKYDGYIKTGLTIKELSEIFHTNRSYLSEYIKFTYGVSFRDWITELRINYAKQLMIQNPRLTILDISERTGFMSPSHFIRLFKESTGYTPTKWKKVAMRENSK